MDALSALLDEVALEGLDGITLPSLWLRLADRNPKFPQKLDDYTKAFLWRSLVHNSDISFYEQPKERDDVQLYNRFESIDPDTGIEIKGKSFENKRDIYPAHFIVDNPAGIQGSCVFFTQRRDVTTQIRSASSTHLLSLDQAWERFGRKLVLVASQKVRFRALIGTESDPDLKLSDESYCVLERVGRSRWQGELQRDLNNGPFKIESRKIHYLRKSLVQHSLVTVQSHVCRLSTGTQQHSCLLLLRRFHVNRRSKYDILMERVSNILEVSPGQNCTQMALREYLNVDERSFKRIFQYMRSAKLVELFSTPLDELDPESGPCLNKRGNKVQVRCIKLVKPYSKKKLPEDDEDEEEEGGSFRPEGRILERDMLSQAYDMVVSSGTKGLTCVAIGAKMNVGKLERRMICRQLEREGVIKGFMEDIGRQRTTKYLSHKCVEVSDKLHQFAKEHERSQLLCSSGGPDSPKPPSTSKTLSNIDMCRISNPGKNNVRVRVRGRPKAKGPSEKERQRDREVSPVEQRDEPVCDEPVKEPTTAAEVDAPSAPPQTEGAVTVVTDAQLPLPSSRNHETIRLLRRKNLIVEAIQDLKIFEGLYPLQKIINTDEKSLGFNTKCCKKTILRLVQTLAREGLIKLYTTTVIQDGVTKKVDLYAHPSIQSSDEIVQRTIDQVRFKMSGSHSNTRPPEEEKYSGQSNDPEEPGNAPSKDVQKSKKSKVFSKKRDTFVPTSVRGLSKELGYQPKMHRMRVVHNFLWYMVYGHPLRHNPKTQAFEKAVPSCQPCGSAKEGPQGAEQPGADTDCATEKMLSEDEEETPQSEFKVYSEEELWKKYIPPVKLHKDYSSGWVMLGDLILCLPLSVFIQIIQVNYKVEGLEDYLNDPEKQHYLVRCLPARMKRQLLYKRKYIFSVYYNLKKLAFMGLIQFGPLKKFRDKDQVFIYVKQHATIVDTTSSEPHYWLVSEPPERPFERRQYTFKTSEDIESFWFDLMCVCLNTPLGVIRGKRGGGETVPSFVRERSVFVGMAYLIKGSLEVVDDGSIPGDGKGAGGLASEFFAHLKRNWLWTNHLLAVKPKQTGLEAKDTKVRLKSLCRNSLQMVLQAERSAMPSYLTPKKTLVTDEEVQVVEEPASRNMQVVGGKQQKRKRQKKDVVKAPRKKKEAKKRCSAHDERDHEALKQMTRQRVYWSQQEDSLMMLCAVATHLLNSKLQRPFVPYCVVRDVLHKEFEKSRDKTSLAVGRRTRYILKNPQTVLNYRICLAELDQDKALLKLLKENLPKNPEDPEACAESFAEYVRLLRQKFRATINLSELLIPDSKEQLFSQFKICAIDSVRRLHVTDALNSTEDIHAIVLHNLIQSTLAMTNSQMKSSRSFQTFHVYSSYSQDLLCEVFVQCRKRGLVNRRRINKRIGPKKNRALPILPMSYQLSHSYYRCFLWRFPQVLCTDSFRFVRDLLNLPRRDDRPLTHFYQETENRAPDGELLESRKTSQARKDMTHKDESNESVLVESKEEEMCEEPTVVDPPDVSDMLQFSLEHPGGACVAALSLMSLGLLSVYLSIPKQMVVVDSTLVDTDTVKSTLDEDEEEEEEAEETKKMEVKAHQASHTKYLMMKGYCAPGIVKQRNLSTNDNIVVESCVMKLQLRDRPAHSVFSLDAEPALDLSVCGPSLLPPGLYQSLSTPPLSADECLARLQYKEYSAEDLQACALLWDTLDQAGERGLDVGEFSQRLKELELDRPPRTRTLQQYTQDLQQEGQVVLVGAYGARWVLQQHAQPWLITLNTGQWNRTPPDDLNIRPQKHDIPFMRKKRPATSDCDGKTRAKRPALDTSRDREGQTEEQLKEAEEATSHAVEVNTGPEDQMEPGEGAEENAEGRNLQPEEMEGEGRNPLPEEQSEKTGAKGEVQEKGPEQESEEKEGRSGVPSRCASPLEVPPAECPGVNVSFVARPWRMVDGKLNRLVCKGMLEAVLYHVMSVPGVTQEDLLLHYRTVLQPQATLELLQALIDLGCVKRKTLVKRPKASLFSRPTPPLPQTTTGLSTPTSGTGAEQPDMAYYEPTVGCVLRLSQVLPHERHWNSETP